jgi:hypothetical protein
MPTIINDNVPPEITAGDAVAWVYYNGKFPASASWVLSYAILKTDKLIEITAEADGQSHLVSLTAADTETWPAGDYQWQAYMSKGAERYTVAEGGVTIRPNFAAAAGGMDTRHHLYIVRDALQAAVEGRASETQISMSASGRTISEMSHTELLQAQRDNSRDIMIYERKMRRKRGQPSGSTIKVRF